MAYMFASRSVRNDSESRVSVLAAVCLAVIAIPAVFAAIALNPSHDREDRRLATDGNVDDSVRSAPPIALDTRLMPVSREEAERLNALRPTDLIDVAAARPFTVSSEFRDDPRFGLAVDCLTQAVYYEAGSESDAGQRAVAQVVLNRVRHPAFPNTVCGVVYQGASLATGCQFTFTCDGSLARQPSVSGWNRARRVALAALSGWVEQRVGTSTHYHASYVLPYWAESLDKVLTVGAHNFYAMRGSLGNRASFVARYDMASELIPAVSDVSSIAATAMAENPPDGVAAMVEASPAGIPVAEDELVAGNGPIVDGGRLRELPRARLRADENRGDLIAGTGTGLLVD